jgi:hypothetical protein
MAAISSPLLETSITGATGALICITASEDVQLDEVVTASQMIQEEAHPDANIIWGATFDPTLEDEMRVTIVATGFDKMKNFGVTGTADEAPASAQPAPAYEAATQEIPYQAPAQVYTFAAAPAAPAPAPVQEYTYTPAAQRVSTEDVMAAFNEAKRFDEAIAQEAATAQRNYEQAANRAPAYEPQAPAYEKAPEPQVIVEKQEDTAKNSYQKYDEIYTFIKKIKKS